MDQNRRQMWFNEIKKHQKKCDQHFFICQNHFEQESFCRANKSLKLNAIPTIFPPNPNGQQTNESLVVKVDSLDPLLPTYQTQSNVVLSGKLHDIQSK